jgi:hypothetical protein
MVAMRSFMHLLMPGLEHLVMRVIGDMLCVLVMLRYLCAIALRKQTKIHFGLIRNLGISLLVVLS